MSATTTERPILFSAPMVRALIDGRKTQTRRVMKPQGNIQPECWDACRFRYGATGHSGPGWYVHDDGCEDDGSYFLRCPYGQPGDRLWVRETFSLSEPCYLGGRAQPTVWYAADSNRPTWAERKWKPSIHMPRLLSRITLEITDVRVQRLREISEEDAIAEGVSAEQAERCDGYDYGRGYVAAFAALWESINGDGSWDADPWVWAISFRRVQQEERP